jgi:4-phosphopantoate--beta-alanine ligase
VDLNPLSRTARAANITIVDNVVRAMPALVEEARELKGNRSLKKILGNFDNLKNLRDSLEIIKKKGVMVAEQN